MPGALPIPTPLLPPSYLPPSLCPSPHRSPHPTSHPSLLLCSGSIIDHGERRPQRGRFGVLPKTKKSVTSHTCDILGAREVVFRVRVVFDNVCACVYVFV
jgi:hypothetical protein